MLKDIIIAKEYPEKVIPLLDSAQFEICVMMYYWGYYSYAGKSGVQKINYAIKSALTRGVKVNVILHCGSPVDHLKKINSETYNHLTSWGARVKWNNRGGTCHAKMIIIDKNIAIIGSHNFSKRSMGSNIETSVILEGSGEIRRLYDFFNLKFSHL